MATDITSTTIQYVLCFNLDIPLLHYIVMEPGQHLSTGQPEVEIFPTEEEAIERMIELGFNPDDYIKKEE